jgi:hypothetical protein
VLLALTAAALWAAVPVSPDVSSQAARRPLAISAAVIGRFAAPSPYAPLVSIGGMVSFSLFSVLFIYYYFEKTQSPEILFVVFFVLSFSLEGMRTMVPLSRAFNLPGCYLLAASRIFLFGRYFGIFSLFAASVYAAGLGVQKQQNILFIMVLAALVIALRIPIDVLSWDSSFSTISGYTYLFRMVETGVFLMTIVSFLISAYSRSSEEFLFVGLGAFLVFAGRALLLGADTWPALSGLAFLIAGIWIICVRLHRVYLWL